MSPPSAPAGSGGGDLLASLLRIVTRARPDADTRLIKKAYGFAAHWHQGQRRRSGDPKITHAVAVAVILAEIGADDATLCAGLLHDVLEDTSCTLAALRSTFGAEIAGLLTATMALDKLSAERAAAVCTDATAAAALAGDQRALLIKVADRLHNMRTLRHIPRAKQMRKSRQTLEVMVPLARTLRVDAIGAELESLASATLQRHGRRPGTASGHVLSVLAALLPASARARWRQEWLAELHQLATRRERLGFAIQIALGIGRLAVTLYRPAAALRRVVSAVMTAAVTASGLVLGGWRSATALAAALGTAVAGLLWILHSDDRTRRLVLLIRVLRNFPGRQPEPPGRRD